MLRFPSIGIRLSFQEPKEGAIRKSSKNETGGGLEETECATLKKTKEYRGQGETLADARAQLVELVNRL